ncbi:MAG TPA: acyl carrier protein [Longimicrobium sp.]|uniref:acyl carrier protein n=1 Tax=Longimicrobium sp. TaxID=2029185 RepID=UPI002EDB40B5
MEDREQIRAFVSRHVRGKELADGEDFFAGGYVNSMFAMQLVQFIESTFGVTCESDDLDIDNFRSVDALTAFVERKRGAGVA